MLSHPPAAVCPPSASSRVRQAYVGYCMRHLDQMERTRRIEVQERLLMWNLLGESAFLPFHSEEGELIGATAGKFGIFSAQNLFAFLALSDARRTMREMYPEDYAELCERVKENNKCTALSHGTACPSVRSMCLCTHT